MSTRKQKRHDELRQAPVAEAIAVGTAAGGLVLGTIQAQAAQPDIEKPAAHADAPDIAGNHNSIEHRGEAALPQGQIAAAEPSPAPNQAAVAVQPDAEPKPVPASVEEPAAVALPADAATIPLAAANQTDAPVNTVPTPIQSQLAAELSEQMTATLVKVIGSVEPGQAPADIGQSIADDIIASAQQIVAGLDIGALLAETGDVADDIVVSVDVPAMAGDALDATSGIADDVLSEVGALPQSILGGLESEGTVATLTDLPAALLGSNGPEGSGGLLSDLFYADGASDTLAIPDLSSAASTLVSDIGGVTGILGLSYVDTPDHQGGHGLNALSLL